MTLIIYHKGAVKPDSKTPHTDIFNEVCELKVRFGKITFSYFGKSLGTWNTATFYKKNIAGYATTGLSKEEQFEQDRQKALNEAGM